MNDVTDFLKDVSFLSSGTEDNPTLFGEIFSFLAASGDWADAVSKLLGILG